MKQNYTKQAYLSYFDALTIANNANEPTYSLGGLTFGRNDRNSFSLETAVCYRAVTGTESTEASV